MDTASGNIRKRKRSEDDYDFIKTIGLIYDETLFNEASKLPKVSGRSHLVFSLMKAYDLLKNFRLLSSKPATFEELCNFHSSDYIDYLKKINNLYTPDDEIELEYGIGYDCPPLDGIYDYCSAIGGSTLTAARALLSGDVDVVINWCGGWHHAQSLAPGKNTKFNSNTVFTLDLCADDGVIQNRDEAEGFCYVNDIALGILELRSRFENILYIDLDIHHGNGVENCFSCTKRVVTVSLHLLEPGFYPGTGTVEDVGSGTGRYYTVNVPLRSGASHPLYTALFDDLLEAVLKKFDPNAIVVQCGADGLSGDPVGEFFNLSHKSYGHCLKKLLDLDRPTLVLGGGGYHLANTARCWTYLSSVAVGLDLSTDIPEHDGFTEYGPYFELSVPVSNRKDMNTKEYVAQLLNSIKANLEAI